MKTKRKYYRKNKKLLLLTNKEYSAIFAASLKRYEEEQCIGTTESQLIILQGLAKDVRAFVNDTQYLENFAASHRRQVDEN